MDIIGKVIVVYGIDNERLRFFKLYDYTDEDKANMKFKELLGSSESANMMTIDRLSEILIKGDDCG